MEHEVFVCLYTLTHIPTRSHANMLSSNRRGFTWNDLMEQMQIERSQREAQRKIEDARARKEEKMFVAGVEAGRVADGIARKNEEKRKRKLESGDGDDAREEKPARVRRRFVQNDVVAAQPKQTVLGDDAKRVLGKIF